jgi:hypothetical protein
MKSPATAIIALLVTALVGSCTPPMPYPGHVVVLPKARISVSDADGKPVTKFDLTLYRCTQPGSQFDRAFLFPNRSDSVVTLEERSEKRTKLHGGVFTAPDAYQSYEPKPYWVACVTKAGYASRRWGLPTYEAKDVTIALHAAAEAGEDSCPADPGASECTPCRSYEYFMYETMRYRHEACSAKR